MSGGRKFPISPAAKATLDVLQREHHQAVALRHRRDAFIVQARKQGATWRRIAEAVDMTEQAVITAATKKNGGKIPYPEEDS